MGNTHASLEECCHVGNKMTKTNRLVVEVYFVPLSATEMEERRRHLQVLLLRGALRFVQQQTAASPPASKSISTELARK
jgi:hypothetical protein